MLRMTRPAEERFWPKVDKSGDCWVWTGHRTLGDYGLFWINEKDERAHRVSWQFHNGSVPDEMHVLHHCDNPPCVNPDHLWLGTDADNVRDKVKKKRHCYGSHHGGSKVDESDVLIIRELRSIGTSVKALSWLFDIAEVTIYQISQGISWRHI